MSEAKKTYTRFSTAQRIEHAALLISFTLLGLTGLPQKYPTAGISQAIVALLGGIETIRIIHRISAAFFLIESIYHLVVVGYKMFVLRRDTSMVPTIKDGRDAIQLFLYNLGITEHRPKMPRYNFTEKAEYWAMIWGLFVMALTGFMLWNPIATTNLLPGEFIPAAKTAHGGEAVLAVLAIILWHFYHVHIRHFNKSMFTGKMDREAMEEEHGAELEAIESGKAWVPPSPKVHRSRLSFYAPFAAVFSLALLAGVYWFVTFEQSAITTVPPASEGEAFVPQTPTPAPTATTGPTAAPQQPGEQPGAAAATAWEGGVDALFEAKCTSCHGSIGGFSAETYEDVMKAVEAGNADASGVVEVQKAGNHPGQFTADELAQVSEWINAGAPEAAGAGGGQAGGAGAGTNPVAWAGLEEQFQAKCGSCHGSMGGFSAESYEDVMKAVKPGDPEGSDLVVVQRSGKHPATFTAEELERVVQWITAGAPEN